MFNARLYNIRPPAARLDELASLLDLTGSLDKPLSSYSHGMARKTYLLAALIVDPDVLILDEPFSGLDPTMVDALDSVIRERRRRGSATLLSSHDLELMEGLSDRIAMLDKGQKFLDRPTRKSSPTGSRSGRPFGV